MGNIRLIALDIDLTLTSKKDVISERNLAAIRAAQAAGVFVTIATGRGFLSSRRICARLQSRAPPFNMAAPCSSTRRTAHR